MDLFSKRICAAGEWAEKRIASRDVREPLCVDWISADAAPSPKGQVSSNATTPN
jgi:hypothetical protein